MLPLLALELSLGTESSRECRFLISSMSILNLSLSRIRLTLDSILGHDLIPESILNVLSGYLTLVIMTMLS